MAFKTAIEFSGSNNEAFFVNDGVITKATLAYDVPAFEGWDNSDNIVLNMEISQDGLQYPVRQTLFGSFQTEETEREVTTGSGKNKKTELVPTTVIKGMGSAFRVFELIKNACESGQVTDEIELAPTGEIVVNGEMLVPKDIGGVVDFDAMIGVRVFYIRYKGTRKDGTTGYFTHRRLFTNWENEDDDGVRERLKKDFFKQVRGGWVKNYVGTVPDADDDTDSSTADGNDDPPF